MGTATMSEPKVAAGEANEPATSVRLFNVEHAKLVKLAALRGESLAVAFRRVFGKVLDSALLAAAESEVAGLKKTPRS